jgi:hypothetical protein
LAISAIAFGFKKTRSPNAAIHAVFKEHYPMYLMRVSILTFYQVAEVADCIKAVDNFHIHDYPNH